METVDKEKDIQLFIADNPWLINVNYQNVPELKDNDEDMELHIEGNKRPDLILKDTLTGDPVIIEFKRYDLTRDTIGQILEYRSRIITSLNNTENILFRIFGNKIAAPRMVIVVRSSDIYGKIACRLQNIDLVEYGNFESKIINGNINFKSIEEYTKILQTATPPMNDERTIYLENNVYSVLKDLFKENNIEEKWKYYKKGDHYVATDGYWDYRDLFLNKWVLKDEEISIGIWEDIWENCDFSVYISYCSNNKEKLEKLQESLSSEKEYISFKPHLKEENENSKDSYFILDFKYESSVFYKNVRKIFEINLKKYLSINPIK